MAQDDPTLQELIVRALTGRDESARARLDRAAEGDVDLRRFRDDLMEVVNVLTGTPDWRNQAPSAELTARVRAAVVAKLPEAPPHFRSVMVDADLGRRTIVWKVALGVLAASALIAGLTWALSRRVGVERPLRLEGKIAWEASLKEGLPEGWVARGGSAWKTDGAGLYHAGSNDPTAALHLERSVTIVQALAFNLDVQVPALDDQSQVTVFLADAIDDKGLVFQPGQRPERALSLEISSAGLVIYGPGQELLHSRPATGQGGGFYRLRLESLGRFARVLVNGEAVFDGRLPQPLHGPVYPGWVVRGEKNSEFRFNAARLER